MEKYHSPRIAEAGQLEGLSLPGEVQLALDDLAGSVREGLLALSVGVGLKVMDELLDGELTALVGPKAKHHPGRAGTGSSRAQPPPTRGESSKRLPGPALAGRLCAPPPASAWRDAALRARPSAPSIMPRASSSSARIP